MMNGFPLRKTAEICEISKNTAFNWRHKILDSLQNMQSAILLEGIVEADETFSLFHTKATISIARHSKCDRAKNYTGITDLSNIYYITNSLDLSRYKFKII